MAAQHQREAAADHVQRPHGHHAQERSREEGRSTHPHTYIHTFIGSTCTTGFQEAEADNSGDSVLGHVHGQHGRIEILQVMDHSYIHTCDLIVCNVTLSHTYIHLSIPYNRIVEDIQAVLGMKISFSITQDNSA